MDALTWGTLIAAGGSAIAAVKFWIDLGKLWQRSNDAFERGNIRDAKYDLICAQFSDYKVEVAQRYATNASLADVERQTSRMIEQGTASVNQRLDLLTSRIDNLINMHKRDNS